MAINNPFYHLRFKASAVLFFVFFVISIASIASVSAKISESDNNEYKDACLRAATNESFFKNFKRNPDCRSNNKELLDDLLTQSVEIFLDRGIINLERVAQDGIRVRAHAGSSSFRKS